MFDLILTYDQGMGGVPKIVPVIIDEPASDDLIAAIAAKSNGTYLKAANFVDGAAADVVNEGLARLVREATVDRAGHKTLVPVVSLAGGRARVDLSGVDSPEGEDENPGFKEFRGVLTSLFSNSLLGQRLVVLAYDETEMDPDVARAARLLLCRQIEQQTLGDVRTLVVLIRGRMDYDEHCSGLYCSARYHLSRDLCRVRHSLETDRFRIRVAAASHERPTVLFLGAGFSVSSGVPLADGVKNEALRRLMGSDSDPAGLAEEFREFLRESKRFLPGEEELDRDAFATRLTLERVLREEFNHYDRDHSPTLRALAQSNDVAIGRPGSAVKELGKLLASDRRLVVVTVNQDTLVERTHPGEVELFVTEEDFADRWPAYYEEYRTKGGKVPLLKLHGTVEMPASVVASVDLTLGGLPESRRQALARLADAQRPPWIYVGYSMRDFDVNGLLGEAGFATRVDESWVAPFPEAHVKGFVGQHRLGLWNERHAASFDDRMITQTSDVFMKELAAVWDA